MILRARKAGRLRGPVTLLEPFAGGASTSLRLVTDGIVDRALISDGDALVAAFWREAMMKPEDLIAAMKSEYKEYVAQGGDKAVARWDHWRNQELPEGVLASQDQHSLAVRCLFLNRTTFSGILHGSAGPIGGRRQDSAYPISCRFNPVDLEERIRWVSHLYRLGKLVEPRHQGWQDALSEYTFSEKSVDQVIAYLDPPYIEKSTKLYRRSFKAQTPDLWGDMKEHYNLAAYLRREVPYRWILSYDAAPDLTSNGLLYGRRHVEPTSNARGAGAKRYAIVRGGVKLRHSAAVRGDRPYVDEMIFTTLSRGDTRGLIDPLGK